MALLLLLFPGVVAVPVVLVMVKRGAAEVRERKRRKARVVRVCCFVVGMLGERERVYGLCFHSIHAEIHTLVVLQRFIFLLVIILMAGPQMVCAVYECVCVVEEGVNACKGLTNCGNERHRIMMVW